MKSLLIIIALALGVAAGSAASPSRLMRDADKALAQRKYERAAALYKSVAADPSAGPVITMAACNGQAEAYRALGRYDAALRAYDAAMNAADGYSGPLPDADRITFNYAKLLTDLGRYDMAETELFRISTSDDAQLRRRMLILRAEIYARQKEYTMAATLLKETLGRGMLSGRDAQLARQNLGYILCEQKNYVEGLEWLRLAADSLSGSDLHNTEANMAMAESATGNHAEAMRLADRAVNGLKRATDITDEYVVALRKQAEVYDAAGRTDKSEKMFREYFKLEQRRLNDELPGMAPSTRLDYWTKIKPRLNRIFRLGNRAPEFLFDVALFRKQTSMLAMHDLDLLERSLKASSRDIRQAMPAGSVMVEIVCHDASPDGKQVYDAVILPRKGEPKVVRLFDEDFINDIRYEDYSSLYQAVSQPSMDRVDYVYSDRELAAAVWKPMLDAMPADTRTVYFSPEGIFHILAIEHLPYDAISELRLHRLSSPAVLLKQKESKKRKKQEPAAKERKLLVVGGLDYDETAPVDYVLDPLADDNTGSEPDHTAWNNLQYMLSCTRCKPFGYLRGTRIEADGIARLIPGALRLSRLSEERIKRELPKATMAHVATHGYSFQIGISNRPTFVSDSMAIDEAMVYSGLALTGANCMGDYKEREDGILSAHEICSMRLDSLRFIALSACQTALGNVSDEGPAGLVRALKMAGAGTIMASLWNVNDQSTAMLMIELYRRMAAGETPHDALRGARQHVATSPVTVLRRVFSPATMSSSGRERSVTLPPFSRPVFWAPFILIDDI